MPAPVSTPPHLPTYHVTLSHERIEVIVNHVYPEHNVTSIRQLESGKSYNNRVYFVGIESVQDHTDKNITPRGLVLKLAGHYFDHRKVENELGCLLLLKKYCPDLPIPDAVAWSANGQSIRTVDGRKIEAEKGKPFSDHSWILESRLLGRVLTVADLDSKHGHRILQQLAKYVTMWRTQVPDSLLWGNLRIQASRRSPEPDNTIADLIPGKTFAVDAFLLNNFYWPNTLLYYPTLAQDQLARLKKEPHFSRNKLAYGREWETWANEELPNLPLCQKGKCILTHLDFSPRNVLISNDEGVRRVTGVLDFEFTGYFPLEEEFLNAIVRQEGDWENRHWNVMMQEMARLGQKVPPTPGIEKEQCFDETQWKQARIIAKVIDRLAPWDVMEGKYEDDELKRELDEAAGVVNDGIKKLRQLGKVRE